MTKYNSHSKLFLLVVIITMGLFSCTNKPEDIKKAETTEIKKEEFGRDIEILITKKGSPNIKITAPKVVRNYAGKPFNEFPEGMNLFVYNTAGTVESTLTAKYGKMGDNSTEMIAKDSVVVISKKGETLNTEHLIWDKENSKIKTEGFVKIKTLDEIIYGDGFESNDDFTEYQITNIHGIVRVKEGDF
ncbi:MAG: LPS export ABC transporter protein LptC [Planctomycetota bacterium]|jgi:LPS export ABC transporter protein LptC